MLIDGYNSKQILALLVLLAITLTQYLVVYNRQLLDTLQTVFEMYYPKCYFSSFLLKALKAIKSLLIARQLLINVQPRARKFFLPRRLSCTRLCHGYLQANPHVAGPRLSSWKFT